MQRLCDPRHALWTKVVALKILIQLQYLQPCVTIYFNLSPPRPRPLFSRDPRKAALAASRQSALLEGKKAIMSHPPPVKTALSPATPFGGTTSPPQSFAIFPANSEAFSSTPAGSLAEAEPPTIEEAKTSKKNVTPANAAGATVATGGPATCRTAVVSSVAPDRVATEEVPALSTKKSLLKIVVGRSPLAAGLTGSLATTPTPWATLTKAARRVSGYGAPVALASPSGSESSSIASPSSLSAFGEDAVAAAASAATSLTVELGAGNTDINNTDTKAVKASEGDAPAPWRKDMFPSSEASVQVAAEGGIGGDAVSAEAVAVAPVGGHKDSDSNSTAETSPHGAGQCLEPTVPADADLVKPLFREPERPVAEHVDDTEAAAPAHLEEVAKVPAATRRNGNMQQSEEHKEFDKNNDLAEKEPSVEAQKLDGSVDNDIDDIDIALPLTPENVPDEDHPEKSESVGLVPTIVVEVEKRAFVLAGPESVISPAQAAAAHGKAPLLSSNPRQASVPSSKGEVATVVVADLCNEGVTTR